MIVLWIVLLISASVGVWMVYGSRLEQAVSSRESRLPPLSRSDQALGIVSAAVAVVALALTVLAAIDNARTSTTDCRTVVDPATGDDVLSCREEGGIEWLPSWLS